MFLGTDDLKLVMASIASVRCVVVPQTRYDHAYTETALYFGPVNVSTVP